MLLMNFIIFRFLWVEFQLQEICSQVSDHDIESVLEALPEDMEETYERIIEMQNKRPRAHRNLARKVLMWIAYAQRPLDITELASAVAIEKDTRSKEMLDDKTPTADAILAACNPLDRKSVV